MKNLYVKIVFLLVFITPDFVFVFIMFLIKKKKQIATHLELT